MAIHDIDHPQGGKNYNYILENRCIYCGAFPKPGEIFSLDSEGDKLCEKHERINKKGDYWQIQLKFQKMK